MRIRIPASYEEEGPVPAEDLARVGPKPGPVRTVSGASIEVLEGSDPVLEGAHREDSLILPAGSVPSAERHPAFVYVASLAPGSRRTMEAALGRIAELVSAGRAGPAELAWWSLRYQHTALIRSALADHYATATANKMLSALRGVLKECFRLGYTPAEEYHRACDLPSVRGSDLPKGRALSHGELRCLFEACANDVASGKKAAIGARDAALIAVLYGCGLRRNEVVSLNLADYDRTSGELRVRGKGGKQRIVYAEGGADVALDAWLKKRGWRDFKGPLFYPIDKAGRVRRRRMSNQAVLFILKKRAGEIGARDFSPHDMRRTFIGDLLDGGADLSTVQKLAGHANVETTARYDRRGERAKKRASSLLHVPYAPDAARAVVPARPVKGTLGPARQKRARSRSSES